MELQYVDSATMKRTDLPLMMRLSQPMPTERGPIASGPRGEETHAEYGTHVPTGPGNNYNDINRDFTYD